MHLVLAARRRIAEVYGPEYPALAAALTAALSAREAAGLATLAYDPADGLSDLGVAPAALDPAALSEQIKAIRAALAVQSVAISSLWIIGGTEVVPFACLPNPMRDRDGPLLTDAAYGLADMRELLPRWPVGRTPDATPAEPGLLALLLGRVAAAHSRKTRRAGPTLGIGSARWNEVSRQVMQAVSEPALLLDAPPLLAGTVDREQLAAARLIYLNLHGVRGGDMWYGQSLNDSDLTPALQPGNLDGLDLDGALVVSQACFAARLDPQAGARTLALTFLAAGVDGFFGALGLTYGALDPPPGESDLLAGHLLRELQRPGLRLGDALEAARMTMLRDLLRRDGGLNADDTKTLLSFLLYGDPALMV